MNDKDQLVIKSQEKPKDGYKILGKGIESLTETSDVQIYDDYGLYQAQLKDFLTQSTDVTLDTPHLEDGPPKPKINKSKVSQTKKRNYDSKASKDRKVKYLIHDKIINFMEPEGETELFDGRHNILKTMFGVRKEQEKQHSDSDSDEDIGINLI